MITHRNDEPASGGDAPIASEFQVGTATRKALLGKPAVAPGTLARADFASQRLRFDVFRERRWLWKRQSVGTQAVQMHAYRLAHALLNFGPCRARRHATGQIRRKRREAIQSFLNNDQVSRLHALNP